MQVFCDLENKEMPVTQDSIVVNLLYTYIYLILLICIIVIVINMFVYFFRETILMPQYDVLPAVVLSTLY